MVGFCGSLSAIELNLGLLKLNAFLNPLQRDRLHRIQDNWYFYLGYHWRGIADIGSPRITSNYCRAIVNKMVAFELGKGFSMSSDRDLNDLSITKDGMNNIDFLTSVWDYNHRQSILNDIGLSKSVTGEAWITCKYVPKEDLQDPYNEYPDGKIEITLIPTIAVFPEYSTYDREKLTKLVIMYEYNVADVQSINYKPKVYKQTWTNDTCITEDDGKVTTEQNPYGFIPFVCIKNMNIAGLPYGLGDLDDLKKLNAEYNLKSSNVSEILDYHASPVTLVFGAKLQNIEKGAKKMWGGISKDARVENLELKSDLGAAFNYMTQLKKSMCEVAGVPEEALGGERNVSNTSGVALSILNAPLIERTRIKRPFTEEGIEAINKMILFLAIQHNIVTKPTTVSDKDFYFTKVSVPDTLPKDELLLLQQIQMLANMGLIDRATALDKLGVENKDALLSAIDEDMKSHPQFYGNETKQINSGITNGQSATETTRIEMSGQNGETK